MSGGSGNAGGGGYSLQARMIALVGVHILSNEPLAWIEMEEYLDIPFAISAETGGPGDDFRVELFQTAIKFEVQVKRGLNAGIRLHETITKFVEGLKNDPDVYCILAIDPTASHSIRTHLLDDLNRLRQGREDGLHKITQDILNRIGVKGIRPTHELARRISLHVFDIEHQPANDKFYALFILRRILANPNEAEAAWSVLVDDALQLIQHRGRRDAHTLAGLLRSKRILLADATPSTSFQNYLHWLEKTTETFLVPGLGVRLPIEQAWVHLQALEDTVEIARPATLKAKLAAYHEWERLSFREHPHSAQDITEFGHRIVVIGGPGSGKSTLCQRTAHQLARSGERVLRVRLPIVAQRCFVGGESIDQAILLVAAAGSSIQSPLLVNTLNTPDCLLADGLDECGVYLSTIAEQLRIWAQARPRTRVVVTTRPIGYDRAFFENWKHIELLPLGTAHIESHARNILIYVENDPVKREDKVRQFQSQMKANPIASMAARSPLLLGFLVQLVHHGITFAGHRAALYEQVLTLWYQMSSKDRNSTVVKPSITFAHEILNYVGWFLQQASLEEGHSKREMIDALASKLHQNGQSLLMTKEKVEHCLEFWQERGVLELLQIGPEDAYTFIHATLGEYVAGRYLASLDDTKIRTHLEKVRHEAHWRETLLLAAGAGKANIIAEHLLFLDRNNDPVATESLLAAAALAESVQSFPVLAVKIARHITDRLCSSIPLVAYESAQNCVGLATQLPEQIGSLLHPLFYHPQSWTRLTALRLMLAAGEAVVNINALEMFFDDLLTPEQVSAPSGSSPLQTLQAQDARRYFLERREPWSTSNEVIALGAKMLVNKRPSEATAIRLERLARLKRDINDSALNALLQGLELLGCTDVADQIRKEYTEQLNTLSWNNAVKKCRQGEKAFLEAVLRATGISPAIEGNQRRPIALSILLYALELPQWPIREWSVFDERYDLAAIDVVLTGTIIALGLSYTEVAIDTAWVLARVTNISQATNAGIPLLSVLSEITVEPEWRRVIEKANLPTADLVRALLHPSQVIAFGAAQLLEAGAGGQETSILLEDILDQGNDFALEMIALIADSIWGKEAFTKLLRRLDSPLSDGCRWLLQALPRLSEGQADEQVREILIRSLTTDNPQIVIAVAETLQSLPDTFLKPSTEIQKAFTLWSTRGDYCEEHQHYVRSECSGRVPLCPRVEILKLLSRVSALPLHEWLDACRDPHQHVRKAALQGVTRTLTSQPEYILEVIGDVNKGQHPSSVLEAILSLPTAHLVSEQKTLLALFSSESAILRRIMIRNAATATWLTKEQAINVAQVALEDSDPTIRNLAVTTMRRLKSSS